MNKNKTNVQESTGIENQVNELLITLDAEVKKSAKKSMDDNVAAMVELQVKFFPKQKTKGFKLLEWENQVTKMVTTLAKEVEKSTRKSLSDTTSAISEMQKQMEEKSLNDGHHELVELSEELRGKLLDIWAQDTGEPNASKKAVDEFVDMMNSISTNKANGKKGFLNKAKFLLKALAATAQTKKLIDTLIKEAVESARRSVRLTEVSMVRLQNEMIGDWTSTVSKPKMEELRGELMEIWFREVAAPITSKGAVDEFVDTLNIRDSKKP